MTALDGADAGPVPAAFVAVTVKVYEVPFVRPVTTIGLDAPLATWPPEDVTVYVSTPPPSAGGGEKLTYALPSPAAAVTLIGAPGSTTNAAVGIEYAGKLVPIALVANTSIRSL
jgi:hypothetical protein